MNGHPYEGKASHYDKLAPGLITAQKEEPLNKFKISGNKPVSAETARFIADRQPGGAIIVWRTPDKSLATVFSRTSRAV